jgi:hypothetical protein
MSRRFAVFAVMVAFAAAFPNQAALAFGLGYSRAINVSVERIQLQRMAFRGSKISLTDQRSVGTDGSAQAQ